MLKGDEQIVSPPNRRLQPTARQDRERAAAEPRSLARIAGKMRAELHRLIGCTCAVAIAGGSIIATVACANRASVLRFPLASSSPTTLNIGGNDRDLALTPDGSRLIYVGDGGTQLFVQTFDTFEPVSIFTGVLRAPFVSPDGRWIGFFENDSDLRKVAVSGGPAITVATAVGPPRGATWGPNDAIVFATSNVTKGLEQVRASGGPTTVLTRPDPAIGEEDHVLPEFLPDGKAVIFTITASSRGLDAAQVAVLDLTTGMRKVLVRGHHGFYVPSGHLLYAAGGSLWAMAFDPIRLETRGKPIAVLRDVVTTGLGAVDAVVADDGTLAYVSGAGVVGARRTLVWVDRQGRETAIPAPPRTYVYPRLSPNGARLVVYLGHREPDLWLWNLGGTTLTKAGFDSGMDPYPLWTSDGRRLIFSSDRTGAGNLFWQPEDGTGVAERLTESPYRQQATAVSPDGRQLIFTEVSQDTAEDVMQVSLDGARRVTPLVQSRFSERNGEISPDGRWLAYEANDSGRFEIYVRPYPDIKRGPWQVSTSGGTRPLWGRGSPELFFVSPMGALMHLSTPPSSTWETTMPTQLLHGAYFAPGVGSFGRTYDLAADGQRFLMIKQGRGLEQTTEPATLIVVRKWGDGLESLLPTK